MEFEKGQTVWSATIPPGETIPVLSEYRVEEGGKYWVKVVDIAGITKTFTEGFLQATPEEALARLLKSSMSKAKIHAKEMKAARESLNDDLDRIASIRNMIGELKDAKAAACIKDAPEEVLQELAEESAELLAV
jgi:hypothetical protein